MFNNKIYIICSAVWVNNDNIYVHQPKNIPQGFVICGRRHSDCYCTLYQTQIPYDKKRCTQGFLTSNNLFVNRAVASEIAFEAGQISELKKGLISEDLY